MKKSNLKILAAVGHGIYTEVQRGNEEKRFEFGVGIPNMRERVKLVGGRFDIDFDQSWHNCTRGNNSEENWMRKLRILIADDHGLVRRGARNLLQTRRGWTVVGEAENGREAIEKAIKLKPDVAVIDISMPEVDGVEVTRQIKESVPDVKVLVLTMHESAHMVRRALDAGANGYLLKSDLPNYLSKPSPPSRKTKIS